MADKSDSILLVGIDEAGYGPLLGPLVVSATAFDVPIGRAGEPLWPLLSAAITDAPRPRDRRIPICDSKKLHRPGEGIQFIERSALAMIAAWREPPTNLRELLGLVAPHMVEHLPQYPWYIANPTLPIAADAGGIRIAASSLSRCFADCGVRLAGFWSEPLLEGQFNQRVETTRNKATVLMEQTLRLVHRIGLAFPDRDIRFLIDKHGGRDHYDRLLMRAFEDAALQIVQESPDLSQYRLNRPQGSWQVEFGAKGDARHLPIALASIVSKYIREAFMHCFNAYWKTHLPDLTPTAGYYTDGHRFLRAIEPHVARLSIQRNLLVRDR